MVTTKSRSFSSLGRRRHAERVTGCSPSIRTPSPRPWAPVQTATPRRIANSARCRSVRCRLSFDTPTSGLDTSHAGRRVCAVSEPRGQLKVTASYNNQMLTVHVQKARNLNLLGRNDQYTNTYISVGITDTRSKYRPDTCCKFRVHEDTTHPEYDDKITFETDAMVVSMCRLVISVCQHPTDHVVGRISFRVLDIINQRNVVDGWYYLLSDTMGLVKHIKVTNLDNVKRYNSDYIDKTIKIMKYHNEQHGLIIRRENSRVAPVSFRIIHVDKDSCSYYYGIREGDVVVTINGHSTSTMIIEEVSDFIRSDFVYVMLGIRRHRTADYTPSPAPEYKPLNHHHQHRWVHPGIGGDVTDESLVHDNSRCDSDVINVTRTSRFLRNSYVRVRNRLVRSLPAYISK